MRDSSPFSIRLELLKMAKDMLLEEYYSKRDKILEEWQAAKAIDAEKSLKIPEYPPYPPEVDILKKAAALNDFISNYHKY